MFQITPKVPQLPDLQLLDISTATGGIYHFFDCAKVPADSLTLRLSYS